MKYKFNPPGILKFMFSDFYWTTNNDKLLLTFDDGPIPDNTYQILNFLKSNNIKALFFCVGNNIRKYPEIAKSILDEGHTIGNHMYNHTNIRTVAKSETQKEIDQFNKITLKELNYKTEFFRPPHGRFNLATSGLMKQNKLKNVMWSLLSYDYKNDKNIVKFALENFLMKNSILVFHDNISSQPIIIDCLEFLVKEAEKKGFEFGDPAECLK
ncbi:MAG: polysaccharide deacetylase family protein [Melioribacteraceae bacterium]|nr:polysaccharide deacetylase family protein [Melioribacteraceae bacterium]